MVQGTLLVEQLRKSCPVNRGHLASFLFLPSNQHPPEIAHHRSRYRRAVNLDAIVSTWPVHAAVAVVGPNGTLASTSGTDVVRRFASVTKPIAVLGILDAVHAGELDLDEPAGPEGSTLRHLLSHASGLNFDDDRQLAAAGTRRIYSNRGIETAGEFFEQRTGVPLAHRVHERILAPLGMQHTTLNGSPAKDMTGTVDDLALLARELLDPRVLDPDLLDEATTVQFPGVAGILPSYGRQTPNDWGLGFEIRSHKDPHWTGSLNSAHAFGHFGQSGSFLWVDPAYDLACVSLSDTDFGPWAMESWPPLSDAVIREFRAHA